MVAATERKPTSWKPVALDGGYGWWVVLGSFLIHVFADGFVYSFGVIAESLVVEFNGTNAELSLVLSLLTGLMLAAGPLASAVCNRIGCRLTTIIGAIIASIGCATSYYADSMLYLCGSVGIIMGVGFGFMYCPAIIIVTMYFEKYRSLATGITVCGAGVGTAVFARVVAWLVKAFGWREVFLIYAGIVLLCIPCGLLYRPVEFVPIYEDDEETDQTEEKLIDGVPIASVEPLPLPQKVPLPLSPEKTLLAPQEMKVRGARSHTAINVDSEDPTSNLQRVKSLDHGIEVRRRTNTVTEATGYLNIKDVFYPGSVTALKEYQADGEKFRSVSSLHSQASVKDKHRNHHSLSKIPSLREEDEEDENLDSQATSASRGIAIWNSILKMIDLTLFLDPVYLLFAVSNFLTSIGFNAPPMFMPMNGEKILGLSGESAAQTVSAYGVANIAGRIAFGLVCDRQLPFKFGKDTARNRLWIYNFCLMICGVVSCFVFIMNDEWVFKGYCFVFGFLISSYVCLTSVVLVDMIGVDRLTSGFGLLLLVQGIATFVGPPIGGYLFDLTQRYDWTFAFCGICLFISGIMLFAVPFLQKDKIVRLEDKEKVKKALLH
uniref:Major facilitator superfamily (MFS) profile domain-containing protein n=1 Tax=Panagrolaimus superbus TaxID=310955 RepID=A0A914Y7S3_9BILA